MRKIERLRKEALEACKFRGHKMANFEYDENKIRGIAACKICDKWIQIDTHPAPYSIDVGGPACAVGCND